MLVQVPFQLPIIDDGQLSLLIHDKNGRGIRGCNTEHFLIFQIFKDPQIGSLRLLQAEFPGWKMHHRFFDIIIPVQLKTARMEREIIFLLLGPGKLPAIITESKTHGRGFWGRFQRSGIDFLLGKISQTH
ncbi:hypothetical protein D3C86_1590900 [compost metagenome]